MKKLFALTMLLFAVSAQAQHRHYHHHHHRGNHWIAPAVVGGVIGYALTRNYYEPVYNHSYVTQPPVYIQQPVVVQPTCSAWVETQYADGTITRTRTCQ